jgi:hypothetical protein
MITVLALLLFNGLAFLGLYLPMRRNGVSNIQNAILISVFVALGFVQIYIIDFVFDASLDTILIWNNKPSLFVWLGVIFILAASEEISRAFVYFRVFNPLNLQQRVLSGLIIGFFEIFIVIVIATYGFAINWFDVFDKGGFSHAETWSSNQFSTAIGYFVPLMLFKFPSIVMHAGASAILKRDQHFLGRVGLAVGFHAIFNAAIFYVAGTV